MKKLLMALAIGIFAVASVSANLTKEEKACIKRIDNKHKKVYNACKKKKGDARKQCQDDVKKARKAEVETCKPKAATPAA